MNVEAVAETQEQIRLWIASDQPVFDRALGILAGTEPYPNTPKVPTKRTRLEQLAFFVERILFEDSLGWYYQRLSLRVYPVVRHNHSTWSVRGEIEREHLKASEFDWSEIADAVDGDNQTGWRN